jgi:hypothetical protein
MTHQTPSPPAIAVADAIVDVGCQIATILHHMETFRAAGGSPPDASAPVDVLRMLLAETLTPALCDSDEAELLRAAHVVSTVATTIENEIFLVDPGELDTKTPRGA